MKPILFNSEMVRAILKNRKTVTRRVVKPQARYCQMSMASLVVSSEPIHIVDGLIDATGATVLSLPYRPGEILYVREAWAPWSRTEGTAPEIHYKAEGETLPGVKWRPSIHMPREAARIFLRVTGVRGERLWDITEEQAEKEGLYKGWQATETSSWASTAKQAFMWVWDQCVKPADRALYGWIANPLVWVIEFERTEKP